MPTDQGNIHFSPRHQRLGQDSIVQTRLVSQILYVGVVPAHIVLPMLQAIGLVVLGGVVTRPLPRCSRGTLFGLSMFSVRDCYSLDLIIFFPVFIASAVNCMSL